MAVESVPPRTTQPSASTVADGAWVKSRTHESYAKTYAIVFPSDEALAGRGMLPYHTQCPLSLALGAEWH